MIDIKKLWEIFAIIQKKFYPNYSNEEIKNYFNENIKNEKFNFMDLITIGEQIIEGYSLNTFHKWYKYYNLPQIDLEGSDPDNFIIMIDVFSI